MIHLLSMMTAPRHFKRFFFFFFCYFDRQHRLPTLMDWREWLIDFFFLFSFSSPVLHVGCSKFFTVPKFLPKLTNILERSLFFFHNWECNRKKNLLFFSFKKRMHASSFFFPVIQSQQLFFFLFLSQRGLGGDPNLA